MGTYWVGREDNQREEMTSTTLININIHRRRNGRGHGGHGPLTFQTQLFLKSFLSFLNTIFIRKTIHQDEESTNLRRDPS